MFLRTAKKLIKSIIFLLCTQFLMPAFVQASGQESGGSFSHVVISEAHHDHAVMMLSLFLSENELEEKEGEGESEHDFLAAELADFTFLETAITEHHSIFPPIDASHPNARPIHKVLCTFII
jgi:hypothetical protein